MPYIPEESIATLNHFYYEYGNRLWGEFGFRDAFNLDENWFAVSYLAIDQGTIAPMIENYRTGLCWDLFMSNPEVPAMLDSIGWVVGIEDENEPIIRSYALKQNYPNPFNPQTTIGFALVKSCPVTLEVFNMLGKRVALIYDSEKLTAGFHTVKFKAKNLASGIYFYHLKAADFRETKKMLFIQ